MTAPLTLSPSERPAPAFLGDGTPKRLLIGGAWVPARSGETFETRDPATGQVLADVSAAGPDDVAAAVAAARRAFEAPSWADITPYERSKVLLRIADVIETHTEELAVLDSLDMGGPLWLTRWMVEHAVEVFRHYAGWPTKIYGRSGPSDPSTLAYTVRQPLGVVAAITAWNGPILQLAWKLAPALATGNTVVAKPAAWSPLSALRVGELLAETGLPAGVVNIVTGGASTGEAMTGHPDVDKISFTGSLAVGRRILEVSSRDLKRVTLELGASRRPSSSTTPTWRRRRRARWRGSRRAAARAAWRAAASSCRSRSVSGSGSCSYGRCARTRWATRSIPGPRPGRSPRGSTSTGWRRTWTWPGRRAASCTPPASSAMASTCRPRWWSRPVPAPASYGRRSSAPSRRC
ncbi:hypothetical protein GCM10020001_002800 [Nonomuraea salmonea]